MSGCVALKASKENMVYKNIAHQSYSPLLKEAIVIEKVSGGKGTNPLWNPEIGNTEFREAVKDTLLNEGLSSDKGKYNLIITIDDSSNPPMGFDTSIQVIVYVDYKLINSTTNKVIMSKSIATTYITDFEDSADITTRFRLAKEGAARENIKVFLEELAKLKIDLY